MEKFSEDWISLNVGGKIFKTTRLTLTKCPNSMLGKMFDQRTITLKQESHSSSSVTENCWNSSRDDTGAYLIDRSGLYFEPILNYLRHGKIIIDPGLSVRGVLEEARFYGLISMVEGIEEKLRKRTLRPRSFYATAENSDFAVDFDDFADDECPSISRSEVVHLLMETPYALGNQLRFQGVNLSGTDLSQGAQLLAVKLIRANLESASLRNCNFEDPHQNKAILEGANLKNANLEGSQMSGVNLRVASLKNASLRNCDLRSAVLAGADLENCDLSGSDLQEANLRGANFTNATFEGMITPLHMSQAL